MSLVVHRAVSTISMELCLEGSAIEVGVCRIFGPEARHIVCNVGQYIVTMACIKCFLQCIK